MAILTAIIPNYNHALFLERRIESILNQSFENIELIILDDASTDNSKAIIEQYRNHPKLKAIVYNEQNSGSPFLQWKKGIELAETEWIWICESDDYCKLTVLESLMAAASDPALVLAYSGVIWVNEAGEQIKQLDVEETSWYEGNDFINKKMITKNALMNAGQVIFRKSTFKSVTIDWVTMKQCGDYAMFCDVAQQGKVYCNGQHLVYFVRHNATVSNMYLNTAISTREYLYVWDWLWQQKKLESSVLEAAVRLRAYEVYLGNSSHQRSTQFDLLLNFAKKHFISLPIFAMNVKRYKKVFRNIARMMVKFS